MTSSAWRYSVSGGHSARPALILAVLVVVALLRPETAHAQAKQQTLTAEHTYLLGDNDSKSDARQACFLEAKRKVIEQAGVYIEATTVVKNLQLTKSEVAAYSAAVLRIETAQENYYVRDGRASLACTVKADVDMADVGRRLAAIAGDKSLQARIKEQQADIRELEQRVRVLSERVNTAPSESSAPLRKERNVVFSNLEDLENRKLAAIQAMTKSTDLISRFIVQGMMKQEVQGIVGVARATGLYPYDPLRFGTTTVHSSYGVAWNYGELWICFFGNGLVAAVGRTDKCSPNLLGERPSR